MHPTADSGVHNFVILKKFGEIETKFETTLACLSGAQMGSNQEKMQRSKTSWRTPFNKIALFDLTKIQNRSSIQRLIVTFTN